MIPNMNYASLKDSYLFYNIAQKTKAYMAEHPTSDCTAWASAMCRCRSVRQ